MATQSTGTLYPKKSAFSELELKNLKPPADGIRLSENGLTGLARRLKNGEISINWTWKFYSPGTGKQVPIGCGTWRSSGSKFGMREIRAKRDHYALQVANGIDPRDKREADILSNARRLVEEQEAAQEREAALTAAAELNKTVADLMREYIKTRKHRDGGKLFNDTFRRHAEPHIGNVLVRALTENQILDMVKYIVDSGKSRTAKLTFTDLSSAFLWAENRQRSPWRRMLAEGNPFKLIKIDEQLDPDYTGIGERVLLDKEIIELDTIFYNWRKDYENAPVGKKYSFERPLDMTVEAAAWIALGTLCRVGELTLARWEHIDFESREWTIPRENVKAIIGNVHKAHSIYLSDFSLKALRRLQLASGHTPFLFPNKKGDAPRNEKEISRRFSDNQTMFQVRKKQARKQTNMLVLAGGKRGNWTTHDLRRTGATSMQKLRDSYGATFTKEVINRCQNHIKQEEGSGRHYFHYHYDEQMKEAWIAWGAKLESLAPHAFNKQ